MLEFLNGNKVYISAAITAICVFCVSVGWITEQQAAGIAMILGGMLAGAFRSAMKKTEHKKQQADNDLLNEIDKK